MTDPQVEEIYAFARDSFRGGQRDFQIQAYPFRMTPANLARYRNDPNMKFWRMLKEGYDHFEMTGQPPKVDVCAKRYVFNSVTVDGVSFNPTGECPQMSVPDPIRLAVQDKMQKDEAKTQIIVAKLEAEEARKARRAPRQEIADADIVVAGATPAEPTDGGATSPLPQAKPGGGTALTTAYVPATSDAPGPGGFLKRLIGKVF